VKSKAGKYLKHVECENKLTKV